MEEHCITTHYTARYYILGEQTDDPQQEVWLVLHGYGQLAQYFVRNFEPLLQEGVAVVAPEGLSLFYLQGTEGRVGATWMTREFREAAIQNYVAYLQQIYRMLALENKRLVLFGFSQGCSTLVRWVVQQRVPFRKMVLWAGEFPPDVNPEVCRQTFTSQQLFYVYGDADPYITPERVVALRERFRTFHFDPEIIRFAGKHTIDTGVLQQLQQKKPL